jgi:hypothetical protein
MTSRWYTLFHGVSVASLASPSVYRKRRTIRLTAHRFGVPSPSLSSGSLRIVLAVKAIGNQRRHTSTSGYRAGQNAQMSAS